MCAGRIQQVDSKHVQRKMFVVQYNRRRRPVCRPKRRGIEVVEDDFKTILGIRNLKLKEWMERGE